MINSKNIWMGVGLVILLVLVVTTPGWENVLGLNASFDMGKYAPALVLLGVLGGLVGFVVMGGDKENKD